MNSHWRNPSSAQANRDATRLSSEIACRWIITVALAPVAIALVIIATIFSAPAFAGQARVFTGSFGGASSTTPDPYPLVGGLECQDGNLACALSIAVDTTTGRSSSGDIYVTDPNGHRVEKFDAGDNFILMFGKDVNKTKVEEPSSTEAERNVCTAASGDTCQKGTEGAGPGAFPDHPMFIAVDGSAGPSAGDVYVANTTKMPRSVKGEGAGEGVVTKLGENGEVISSWGVGGQMHGSGQQFGSVGGVTVDSSGNLWVYGATEEEEVVGALPRVLTVSLVFELNESGSLLTSWKPSGRSVRGLGGIAVDEHQHVYLGTGTSRVVEYEPGDGKLVGTLAVGEYLAADLRAHTIDVLTGPDAAPHTRIDSFETSCTPLPFTVGACSPVAAFDPSRAHLWRSFAVNYGIPGDTLYLSEEQQEGPTAEVVAEEIATVPDVTTLPAAPVSASTATLRGTVNPDGVAIVRCFFEWGESGKPYEHTAPCTSPGASEIGAGSGPVAVHAQIAIQPGKSYHFRLVAANARDVNEPVQGSDVLLGPPRVDSTSVTEVTASSATLLADVNPQNLETGYRFEYLTEAEFDENGESFSGPHPATSVPVPDGELGPGQEDASVSRHIVGLSRHTAYRYRLVAHNVLGEGAEVVAGPAEAFTTRNTGEFGLLDGRQWEMVSSPDKHGALVEPIGEDWLIEAAADGGRLAYVTRSPTESNPAGYAVYQSVLATRGAAGGWSSHDLSIPHIEATGLSVGEGWEYRFFTEDLSQAVVQPFGSFVPCKSEQGVAQPCLSPNATEQTPFLASNYSAGSPTAPCTDSCYTPLVSGAEGYANVPPETVFGQLGYLGRSCPPALYCGPKVMYTTPDASHVLLTSWSGLIASPSSKAAIPKDSLYEWSRDRPPSEQIRLVSVLPGSSDEAVLASKPNLGFFQGNARHVISDDGARVAFYITTGSLTHLYLRENATQPQSPLGEHGECLVVADACTIQLDAGPAVSARFQTANRAVTRIFFTEEAANSGEDLYEYNVEQRKLVRMTEGAQVLGSVIGAAEDGSRIYFVGNGALAPHAVAGHCTPGRSKPEPACNLYEMHYDGAHWEPPILIAVLSSLDQSDVARDGTGYAGLGARVSPNGEWLAFTSVARLTGYDNQDVVSDQPDLEVYEFNAATDDLECVSCSPTGARPHGVSSEQIRTSNGGIAGGEDMALPGWVAANLPPWTPNLARSESTYQSRYLSDSGRLFFNSADALVPKDTNGTEDVYEYEPVGVPAGEHACSASAENGGITFKPSRSLHVEGVEVREGAGCVGLISSGESANESGFLDASESGSEVFFITTAKLSSQDGDTSYDVYDARECTDVSPCFAAPASQPGPCDTEASCRPAPTPQPDIFAPSGSATFSGPGNLVAPLVVPTPPKALTKAQKLTLALRACRKQRSKKKRAACERSARKKYGASTGPKARKAAARGRRGG